MKKKILLVFGTRPEAIKMIPVVKEFKKYPEIFDTIVCVTGQHKEMLKQVLDLFDVIPDFDLDIMKPEQDLYDITSRILLGMRKVINLTNPFVVLVHGDTTTTISVALASFYAHIPVGHVEAGLRTYNKYSPWPEEINRQLTSRIATFHFSPTFSSKENLLKEGVRNDSIIITGNTVIDSLFIVSKKIKEDKALLRKLENEITYSGYDISRLKGEKKLILITGHRRENFGEGFLEICKSIKYLTQKYPEIDFVYPMHLNPNVRKPIAVIFGEDNNNNMFFIEPLEYFSFILLMEKSYLILTDSGGVQEEAPSLGKPVLVMRNTTERPEAVEAGTVKLVGTSYEKIVSEFTKLVEDKKYYNEMSTATNPYGDGFASERIVELFRRNK